MTLLGNDPVHTERRATPREHIRSLIYLSLQANNGGILLDLSPNGMRVSVAHPLHTGAHVLFSFGCVSNPRIEGIGYVAWIARCGKSAGICFQSLSAESTEKIAGLIQSASIKPAPDYLPPAHESEPFPNGHVELPVHAHPPHNDTLPDFSSYPFGSYRSSRQKNTHRADFTNGPSHEDNQSSLPSDYTLANTTPAFMDPQSNAVPHQVETQSQVALANSRTSHTQSGINDPLKPFTLTPTYDCPLSPWALIGKAIVSAFIAIGGALESDWHAITGLLLMAAGFIALSQHPSLIVLAVALWIAAVSLLTDKKGATQKADP